MGHAVLPDASLEHRPVREIWTRYHAELGQIPDWFLLQFVSANPPSAADRPGLLAHNPPSRRSLSVAAQASRLQ
ncbi:hypothetical protein [Streptomyces goshikiensis]